MEEVDRELDIPPTVRFHTFGESSIDFNVIMHSSNFDHQFLLKHEFIKALTKRYREEGIEIPFPIRTIVQDKKE
jgi:small-conductance mechanosensitive channel